MCGITGFISNDYSKQHLIKMTKSLTHRGPDAEGYYYNNKTGTGLGHRRLSIIDLSKDANQPMTSSCGRYVIVYNGEVYNFKDIAKKIVGHEWKTNSDTEVIIEAFSRWGIEVVNELNGMFAIAIYDLLKNKLTLIRDRMGIKPLYFLQSNNKFIFASEIKAFKELDLNLNINLNSIYAYLHIGYIPSSFSAYNEIKKVKPGTIIQVENHQIKEIKYWDINKLSIYPKPKVIDFNQAKSQLKKLLTDSIKKRLISDVPIGTFLSGGTDSSLVTSIAQKVNKKPINTFSIGFKEAKYNESNYAKKVAEHLKTNHTEFILTEKEAIDELENIMFHFDEPFTDSSALPTMLVSKMARKNVTVCLTGDGGDELFMGYGAYNWAKRLNNPFYWNFRHPISKLLLLSNSNQKKRAGMMFNCPSKNWKSHIFSQEQYLFSEKEIKKLLNHKIDSAIIDKINNLNINNLSLNNQEQQALFDLNNYLKDDLLIKVDRASMYTSLEARVPMLDHNIVEYTMTLPYNFKVNNKIQKHILKEVLYDFVPKSIMERPKWGFSIPLEKWLKKDLKHYFDEFLDSKTINEYGIINYSIVNELKYRFFSKEENYLYNRLWSLMLLHSFLKRN